MKRTIAVIGCIILFLTISILWIVNSKKNPSELTAKIDYYGSFVGRKYEPMPGEKPVKLPVLLNSWPAEFYHPPDVIDVVIEFDNQSKTIINHLPFQVKIRYKLGEQVIVDEPDMSMINSSKNRAKWVEPFITKRYELKTIKPKEKAKITIARIYLEKDMYTFDQVSKRPWAIETNIKCLQRDLSIKTIGYNILTVDAIYD